MSSRSSFRIAAGAFVLLGLLSGVAAQTAGRGDLWDTTSQSSMTMGGMSMPMPPQTHKVCALKTWTRPPVASNRDMNCTISDFATAEQRVTWTSVCTGQMPMTGKGEIVRQGADAYAGTVKYTFAEGGMTVAISGRKVGECDNPQ